MTTENRSSNTEMVSAKVCGYTPGQSQVELRLDQDRPLPAWLELGESITIRPAEQHQGEPVALPARKPWHGLLATADNLRGEGWNACLEEVAKLGPLYTRPVQGEPVAHVYTMEALLTPGSAVRHHVELYRALPSGTKLYTHADPGEVERLRAALKFYADREHYHFESGKWDTVSGEPSNILWCGDEPDFIEDGAVARATLERKPS